MLGIRGLAEQPQSKKKLPRTSCQRNEISTIENPWTLHLLHLPIFLCLFYEIGGKGKSTLTPRTSKCSYSDRVRYPPQTIRNRCAGLSSRRLVPLSTSRQEPVLFLAGRTCSTEVRERTRRWKVTDLERDEQHRCRH